MPWSAGLFTRTDGTRNGATVWTQAKVALVKILALDHDTHDQDLANGINNCLTKDGTNKPTANIDFNNFKILNMADGVGSKECLTINQIGSGLDFVGGKIIVSEVATRGTFTASSLSAYKLTITHNKGLTAPYTLMSSFVNASGKEIIPDIYSASSSKHIYDFTNITISGTCGYIYI